MALAYAPRRHRVTLGLLFALDERLAAIVRTVREPMLNQIRLAWWREALGGLGQGEPPVDPLLVALGETALDPATLAALVDGWEAVLGDPDETALLDHAKARGGALFGLAGQISGTVVDGLAEAGCAWSLADIAAHPISKEMAVLTERLVARSSVPEKRIWPASLRHLAVLVALGRKDRSAGKRLILAIWAGFTRRC